MGDLFSKRSVLISLVLICTMQSFSVLKSMEATADGDKVEDKKKKKSRVKKRKDSSDNQKQDLTEVTDEDATSSEGQESVAPEEDESEATGGEPEPLSSPGCLKRILSKLMCPLRTATSFAKKEAIVIAMMTVITYAAYWEYHHIQSQYERIMSECPDLSSQAFQDPEGTGICIISNTSTSIEEYNKTFWPFLYKKVTQCTINPEGIILFCKSHLESIGLGGYWNKILSAATRMCSNDQICNYFLSKLPEAATCWATWEAFKNLLPCIPCRLPKIF